MFVNSFFEKHVERLFDAAQSVATALTEAGIEYRVVGGLATYILVDAVDPIAARLTRDIDVLVRRQDLEATEEALRRHSGADGLAVCAHPKARTAIHLVIAGEKFHPMDPEPLPDLSPSAPISPGFMIAPALDIIRMKLISFRLIDKVHIRDLDGVGLITPEIEAQLSEVLRRRLRHIRATR